MATKNDSLAPEERMPSDALELGEGDVLRLRPVRKRRRALWLSLAFVLGIIAVVAISSQVGGNKSSVRIGLADPSLPDIKPFTFQNVDAKSAFEMNQAVPNAANPGAAALPFMLGGKGAAGNTALTALGCLTSAVYYEAGFETDQGQRAVAQVVLNRVRHPAYPNSVCGVVFQGSERRTGCQFTFTCDGSINRPPNLRAWARSAAVAQAALGGYVEPSVGTATHYHTVYVVPYWRSSLEKITTIGAHIFYRWAGKAGRREAFAQRYSGIETVPITQANLATGLPGEPDGVIPGLNLGVEEQVPVPGSKPANQPPSALPPPPPLDADAAKPSLYADEKKGVLILNEKPEGNLLR